MRSFSLVIVISILVSLLVSFTLVPLLTSRFGKLKEFRKNNAFDKFLLGFEHIITWMRLTIISGARWALNHKAITTVCAFLCLLGSCGLLGGGYIQTDFMDAGDRGEFIVAMELDRTATLEQTNGLCLSVRRSF
jgi:HAE1 family hydrophobic/amphiphilic exporter-1